MNCKTSFGSSLDFGIITSEDVQMLTNVGHGVSCDSFIRHFEIDGFRFPFEALTWEFLMVGWVLETFVHFGCLNGGGLVICRVCFAVCDENVIMGVETVFDGWIGFFDQVLLTKFQQKFILHIWLNLDISHTALKPFYHSSHPLRWLKLLGMGVSLFHPSQDPITVSPSRRRLDVVSLSIPSLLTGTYIFLGKT